VKKAEETLFPFFFFFCKHGPGIITLEMGFMRFGYQILVAALLAGWPQVSPAITLTNRDPADQKLIVIEGDKESEMVLKAGEKRELCQKSCVIRLPDGEDYEFDGPEVVSLEEGLLFLDNPEEDAKAAR
jgi:hypothetical protein